MGLLWLAKTRDWARKQKIALSLLGAALAVWAVAWLIASGSLYWKLMLAGALPFFGFLALANACREYHEKHRGRG